MKNFIKVTVLFFLFFSQIGFSQLSNFSLTVTKTDETCTGNGSLTFNVANTTSGSTILYSIYLFPNLTTPITTLTTNSFTGLSSGNYRVVALQSLGGLSNSQQQDIQINNLIVPLVYNLVGQPVSCQGNGSITVNVTQGTPVTYEIISGPVIVAPQTSNSFAGLGVGNYNVRVNDACGDGIVQTYTIIATSTIANFTISSITTDCSLVDCNTMAASFTINAIITNPFVYPLTIVFTVLPPNSATPIVYNQTITSGSGLVETVNLNIPFFNNQSYNYNIKVTDGCGKIKDLPNSIILKKLTLSLSTQPLNSCFKQINLNLCNFIAPYTVNFITTPAGFNPTTYNSSHPGPFSSSTSYISTNTSVIPDGLYVISVTDACGRTAQSQINVTKSLTDYVLSPSDNPCNPTYTIRIPASGPLVTSVIITAAPAILNYTFPYDVSSTIVAGQFEMMLTAPGSYTFTGTNVCGDAFLFIVIVPPVIPPTITAVGNSTIGCATFNGFINISINGAPMLTTVTLLQAPSNYIGTLPQNVSQFIISPLNKTFFMQNLPIGNYVFSITDSCGTVYNPVNVTVPLNSSLPIIYVDFVKGCNVNYSSLRLISVGIPFQEVIITAAPTSYLQTLPYNVSFNLSSTGIFYMNSFPAGNYTFKTKDVCNNERNIDLLFQGYTAAGTIDIQANCGSFNINMQHLVNEPIFHYYWLQKLNPVTNQWVHPYTGIVYNSGAPTANNSFSIQNLAINFNIALTGTFRIIKEHYVHANGTPLYSMCFDVIKTFDFFGDLKIISANTFPCSNGINEVIVTAEGVAPLQFKITTKNGVPFVVNNGTSNIFSGLAPAIYNFQVRDLCGNIVNRIFDINLLPEPTITPSNLCDGQSGQLSVQAISYLNYQWWKGTDTGTILSTTNVLTFNPFSTATTPGTYFVRIYSTNPLSCANKIVSYVVPVVSNPNAGQNRTISICNAANPIDLFSVLLAPFDTGGIWTETTSSGNLNGNIWSPIGVNFGTYIFNYAVAGFCGSSDDATITLNFNQGPPIPIITSLPQVCNGNVINLNISAIPNATYQWTGPNNFTSNNQNVTINNATNENTGLYTVRALLNGCETTSSYNVNVNQTPNFTLESGCLNSVYTLNVVPTNNSFDPNDVFYNWTGPNGYTSSLNPIILSGLSSGVYEVTVTNTSGCFSKKIINVSGTFCEIPNIITPNNDGSNEFFELSGLDVTNLQIFSRWGRLVYEKNNYINQWNGQNMNNEKLPDGTYFYFIKLASGNELRGWILVAFNSN